MKRKILHIIARNIIGFFTLITFFVSVFMSVILANRYLPNVSEDAGAGLGMLLLGAIPLGFWIGDTLYWKLKLYNHWSKPITRYPSLTETKTEIK